MYSYHPPDIVTVNRSPEGTETPQTESPLSSAPNSPRSPPGLYQSSATLLEELLQQEKPVQEQQQQQLIPQQEPSPPSPLSLPLHEAPFDEDVDEKKEGEELLAWKPPPMETHETIIDNEVDVDIDIVDDVVDVVDDDDDSEPPSLSVHRTPRKFDSLEENDTIENDHYHHSYNNEQPMMTPLQQELQSPPPLVKQTMPWEAAMVSPDPGPLVDDNLAYTHHDDYGDTEDVDQAPMDESHETLGRTDSNKENPSLNGLSEPMSDPSLSSYKQVHQPQEIDESEGMDDFEEVAEGQVSYGERPTSLFNVERAVTEETLVMDNEYKPRPTLHGYRSASEPVLQDWNKYLRKNYRQITPKRDLKMSEKSAAWLQEEFKRRSTIKQEINKAILARSSLSPEKEDESSWVNDNDNNTEMGDDSLNNSHDDGGGGSLAATRPDDQISGPPSDEFAVALSKALEALPPSSSPQSSNVEISQHSEDDEVAALTTAVPSDDDVPAPRRLDYEYQQEMHRFVDQTRAALRESETEFRSLAAEIPPAPATDIRSSALSGTSNVTEESDVDITMIPVLVHSMDSYLGIAKGDITLSLLSDNTDTPQKATWANRVHGAIWRCRHMRRNMGGIPILSQSPARSTLPVDMDNARVTGGIRTVQHVQEAALRHLQQDEIDEAMELFEDIIFSYYAYFDRSLRAREANPGTDGADKTDFRPYIGVALHNLGILNLLKGQYREALSYFGRALDHRKVSLGEGHPDHVASLVKYAICLYAGNEFAGAHAKLEQALVYARKNSQDLGDRMQMAEILNNLGCLAYMCGQPVVASTFFRESLDVQFAVLSHSLYLSSAAVGQSITLNISIIRANIGFVKLVTKEIPAAVAALENALMEQQLLLLGTNSTLLATMDHLALANLLHGDPQKTCMMFGRILELQQKEYGLHDPRCYMTMDKIKIVQRRGTNFEQAVEELRKTFSIPEDDDNEDPKVSSTTSSGGNSITGSGKKANHTNAGGVPQEQTLQKSKSQKNKMLKVFTSIRKKKSITSNS